MHPTPTSLIERLRRLDDPTAWSRFVYLYTPLLLEWSRRLKVPPQDGPDLVQTVLVKLLQGIARFEYREVGSFRAWLFATLRNCCQDRLRAQCRLPVPVDADHLLAAGEADPIPAWVEHDYQQYLLRRVATLVQAEFSEVTWRAFQQYVLEDRPAPEVAAELGITANAVYLARGRILRRIREELGGLLD